MRLFGIVVLIIMILVLVFIVKVLINVILDSRSISSSSSISWILNFQERPRGSLQTRWRSRQPSLDRNPRSRKLLPPYHRLLLDGQQPRSRDPDYAESVLSPRRELCAPIAGLGAAARGTRVAICKPTDFMRQEKKNMKERHSEQLGKYTPMIWIPVGIAIIFSPLTS